jgi:hypothetical protein
MRTDGHDEAKVGCRNFTNEAKNLVGKLKDRYNLGNRKVLEIRDYDRPYRK